MQKPTRYCKQCGKKLDWIGRREFCNQKCVNRYHYLKKEGTQ